MNSSMFIEISRGIFFHLYTANISRIKYFIQISSKVVSLIFLKTALSVSTFIIMCNLCTVS